MSLPKALLCHLGKLQSESQEEMNLRTAGFATAVLSWRELEENLGWTQLAEILGDEGIGVWVLAGPPEAFTKELVAKITMITLALNREKPPLTAFVLQSEEILDKDKITALPPLMSHVKIYFKNDPFAGRLMAARFKPAEVLDKPFYIQAHIDPLLGIWLEIGPDDEPWAGFMAAVTATEIVALGVGPKGVIPKTCVLEYPMLGLKGQFRENDFHGCAAKNILSEDNSAFIKLKDCPETLIIGDYPDGETDEQSAKIMAFA